MQTSSYVVFLFAISLLLFPCFSFFETNQMTHLSCFLLFPPFFSFFCFSAVPLVWSGSAFSVQLCRRASARAGASAVPWWKKKRDRIAQNVLHCQMPGNSKIISERLLWWSMPRESSKKGNLTRPKSVICRQNIRTKSEQNP